MTSALVKTSWESKRANFTQAAILQPRVHLLLVLAVFPAFAASTWQEGRHFDRLDGCKKHRLSHNIEQLDNMVPFVASECAFGQHVCQLVSSVDIFDLDI